MRTWLFSIAAFLALAISLAGAPAVETDDAGGVDLPAFDECGNEASELLAFAQPSGCFVPTGPTTRLTGPVPARIETPVFKRRIFRRNPPPPAQTPRPRIVVATMAELLI